MTTVLTIDSIHRDAPYITQAAAVLRGGGLVAFPTETVYGLGANALDASAVARIFAAKDRPATNPVIVHIADSAQVKTVASIFPDVAAALASRFWPGPLTLILPKRPEIPDIVSAGGPTVAVRVPAHPVARALLKVAGIPIAAPSANRSTRLSPTTAAHVLRDLDGRIDLILDAGPTTGGLESTVLDVTTDPPRVLRPGLISIDAMAAIIGSIQSVSPEADSTSSDGIARAPGQMRRHYAPRATLELADSDGRERVKQLLAEGLRVGWMTWRGVPAVDDVTRVELPLHATAYAASLYAALHQLDDANVDRIVVARPPTDDAWLAVNDRLRRASTVGDS